jgi:hypothetical protein
MKKSILETIIVLFFFICINGAGAQTVQNRLDQVGLFKQFVGSWKCDIGNDSTAYWEFRSFGTGLECYVKYMTRGKIFMELKSIYGYDKRVDKYIAALLTKGKGIEIFTVWFFTDKNYKIMYFSDMADPEKASIVTEGEFMSTDKIIVTKKINGKPVNTLTYTRIK